MPEILTALAFLGLVLSSRSALGVGNPFQIYFYVWFFVFLGYFLGKETFVAVDSIFFLFLFFATVLALIIQFIVVFRIKRKQVFEASGLAGSVFVDKKYVFLGQIFSIFLIPLVFMKAQFLSGGESVFSVLGYMQLRSAMTVEGEGYGLLAYSFVFSFVITSLSAFLYAKKQIGVGWLAVSIFSSLLYAYFSTGRTFVLLLFCVSLVPLMLLGVIRAKAILFFIAFLALLFIFVASMTSKGISIDDGVGSNFESFLDNLRGYTVAPLVGMAEIVKSQREFGYGENSFRMFHAVLYALGFTKDAPVALIRDYAYVPDPTNVYTVYEVYFKDFSYFGFFVPPLFLFVHYWLYLKAKFKGGVWIFWYGASVYPLVMQFFQDQYFSLLSQWLQISFWYWFFVGRANGVSGHGRNSV